MFTGGVKTYLDHGEEVRYDWWPPRVMHPVHTVLMYVHPYVSNHYLIVP